MCPAVVLRPTCWERRQAHGRALPRRAAQRPRGRGSTARCPGGWSARGSPAHPGLGLRHQIGSPRRCAIGHAFAGRGDRSRHAASPVDRPAHVVVGEPTAVGACEQECACLPLAASSAQGRSTSIIGTSRDLWLLGDCTISSPCLPGLRDRLMRITPRLKSTSPTRSVVASSARMPVEPRATMERRQTSSGTKASRMRTRSSVRAGRPERPTRACSAV